MLTSSLLKKLLNVKHTVIEKVEFHPENFTLIVHVHPTKGQQFRCSICGRKARRYDEKAEKRFWRTLDLGKYKIMLCSKSYRVCCPEHGVITALVPWARHASRFTYDFEQAVAWLTLQCSKQAVSELMRIAWNSVGPIVSRVRKDLDLTPESRYDNLERIGIDETSYRKGHKYMTVVVNHDNGKVVWVAQGHGKEVLTKFFEQLTPPQRSRIKLVSADGARWIKSCVEEFCPNARRCIDAFHVVEWVNEALNLVRLDAWHDAKAKDMPKRKVGRPKKGTAPKDNAVSAVKGAKYALGKNPENLTQNQRARLELIADTDNRLWRAYKLKEELRTVFKLGRSDGETVLAHWIKWAQHCRIPSFVELQRKIRRHQSAIMSTLEFGLSNARIEAVNNKIKLSIRMAYGFRNMENMLDMIMLRCSNLKVPVPWQS